MNRTDTLVFTAGDLLVGPRIYAVDTEGQAVVFDTGDTATFGLARRDDGTIAVNDQGATVVNRGTVGPPATPAELAYDWGTGETDAPGEYKAWFTRIAVGSGKKETFRFFLTLISKS